MQPYKQTRVYFRYIRRSGRHRYAHLVSSLPKLTEYITNACLFQKQIEYIDSLNMEGTCKHMSETYVNRTFTSNYYEYERDNKPISVVGRLRNHTAYWQSIGCSDYILNVIKRGYVIPIVGDVEPAILGNNKSSSRDEIEVK